MILKKSSWQTGLAGLYGVFKMALLLHLPLLRGSRPCGQGGWGVASPGTVKELVLDQVHEINRSFKFMSINNCLK